MRCPVELVFEILLLLPLSYYFIISLKILAALWQPQKVMYN